MRMNQSILRALLLWLITLTVCAQPFAQVKKPQKSTETKKQKEPSVADLEQKIAIRSELIRTEEEIQEATKKDQELAGGLVKSLIAVRLEILKTNRELLRQRIYAIESGAPIKITLSSSVPDPAKAADLQQQIAAQRSKVLEAQANSDKYSGGLVKSISESTLATSQQTLAMLEQQYLIAKYGLALPSTPKGMKSEVDPISENKIASTSSSESLPQNPAKKCIEIGEFDSNVIERNSTYVEIAWKADIKNSCGTPYRVRVRFVVSDKDEFELDSDDEIVMIQANDIGKVRARMLVSPPDKAARIAKQGVRISIQ